jgi:FAD/FMN-containing dehydrogenase
LMKRVKTGLDPQNLLSPGRFLSLSAHQTAEAGL